MPGLFVCPSCRMRKKVKEDFVGKKIRCPKCQSVGLVKRARTAATASRPEPASDAAEGGEVDLANLNLAAYQDLDYQQYEDDDEEDALEPVEESGRGRRSGKQSESESELTPAMIGGLVLLLVAGLGVVLTAGIYVFPRLTAVAAIEAPSEYEKVHHLYGEFYVELPTEWEREDGGGMQGVGAWLRCRAGEVRVEIREDDWGTVIANAASAGANAQEISQIFGAAGAAEAQVNPADPDPARTIHDRARQKFEPNFRSYDEGVVTPIATPFGPGRVCAVELRDSSRPMKGIRATVYSGRKAYTIFCRCHESNFETLRPVFDKIIASMEGVEPKFH